MDSGERKPQRVPLTRERIIEAAVAIADRHGVDELSMRKLGEALGVEAMSLYNHVAGKEQLIDGMVDAVFGEIGNPSSDGDWRTAIRANYVSTRQVLAKHHWSIALMESRAAPGLANLRHHNAVLGCLRGGGFSISETAQAYSMLDSYAYGFALTEKGLPFEDEDQIAQLAESMLAQFPLADLPHLAEIAMQHVAQPGYDYGDEFERGLDVLLDALERLRTDSRSV